MLPGVFRRDGKDEKVLQYHLSQACQAENKHNCAQDGNVLHKKDLSFLACYSLSTFTCNAGFSEISMAALEMLILLSARLKTL